RNRVVTPAAGARGTGRTANELAGEVRAAQATGPRRNLLRCSPGARGSTAGAFGRPLRGGGGGLCATRAAAPPGGAAARAGGAPGRGRRPDPGPGRPDIPATTGSGGPGPPTGRSPPPR